MSAAARAAVLPQRDDAVGARPVSGAPARDSRPPARPRLRLVPAANLAAPRAPFVMLVLALVVGGLVSLLMLNTLVNENSFRIHELTEQQDELALTEQRLQRQLDERETTPALAAEAERLGLVPAGTPAFIRLPDGKVLGVPTPAKASPKPGARR
jgi:hypothetical protein